MKAEYGIWSAYTGYAGYFSGIDHWGHADLVRLWVQPDTPADLARHTGYSGA